MQNVDIELLIKLFKSQKISEYTFGSELENIIGGLTRTNVEFIDGTFGSSGNDYLVSSLPILIPNGYKFKFIVDRTLFKGSLFSDTDISRIIEDVSKGQLQILNVLNKKFNKKKNIEIGMRELIKIYLELYLANIKLINPSILSKIQKENILNINDLEKFIFEYDDNNLSLEEVLEFISVKHLLPEPYIMEAKKQFGSQVESIYGKGANHDEPDYFDVKNMKKEPFDNDKDDPVITREIPHDYKPPYSY